MLPAIKAPYPTLEMVPTAQNKFAGSAPFTRITDEYAPAVKVVPAWNIHTAAATFAASIVTNDS